MNTIVRIAGIVLFSMGAWIIALYWVYWARVAAMRLGHGRVKNASMTPGLGPLLVLSGGYLAGEPIRDTVGWWVVLLDLNTYVLVVSVVAIAWSRFRSGSGGKGSGPSAGSVS